uniref:IgLON family member 5 n=1 Tax=Myripristis murdjan TaxID=586833 RepID=A0A668A112_9TELE
MRSKIYLNTLTPSASASSKLELANGAAHLFFLVLSSHRCRIDEEVTHKAWLNRSNILFTGTDKWSLDKRVTLVNSNNSDFSIHISKVQVTDEGPYTCTFQAYNKPRITHVYLIVQVPARIVNISKDVSVNEGENVNLFCLAVGRPEPTHPSADPLGDIQFLDITEIKRQQGEDYECITNNGVAPPDKRKVKVTVNYPPMITDVKNMPAQLGKTAILRCEAMAVPTASFEWYRDDHRPVENDNTLRIKNEKTRSLLLFTNVTDKHFGNYTCFASNRLGASNASMLLFRKLSHTHDPYIFPLSFPPLLPLLSPYLSIICPSVSSFPPNLLLPSLGHTKPLPVLDQPRKIGP